LAAGGAGTAAVRPSGRSRWYHSATSFASSAVAGSEAKPPRKVSAARLIASERFEPAAAKKRCCPALLCRLRRRRNRYRRGQQPAGRTLSISPEQIASRLQWAYLLLLGSVAAVSELQQRKRHEAEDSVGAT